MLDNFTIFYSIIVLALIFISAFFSCAETAVTTSSRAKIYRLKKEGNKKAEKVELLLRHRESLIGTILLANNAVNILASAITTSILIKMFGTSGVFYATILMTLLVVIFGEIAPKTYALQHPEKIALSSAWVLLLLVKIFYPITKWIQRIIGYVMSLFSSKNVKELISDLDEIRGAIELKHKEGSIIKYDKDMIDSILDLGEMEISGVMVHRKNIQSLNADENIEELIKKSLKINHSRIPLWKENRDNIVSILHVRKLVKILHKNGGDSKKIKLSEITTPPWFVPSTNTLRSQLISFRKKKKKLAIVIDEYGALMGMITLEDILEEIVGDIADKKTDELNKIIKLKNGGYKIAGELPIRDINRKLNWNLPEHDENISTLAGLVISKIERIPGEKEIFEFENYSFKILRKEGNKIALLRVEKI